MANTIRIKRSTGSDAPSSLANAELAFAEGSKKLFIGIGTGGAGGTATSIEAIGGTGAFIDSTTTRSANAVFAGPSSGSAAAPTFRSLAAADIPSIAHTKISDFDDGVRVNRLDLMAAPLASVSANSQKITNLADPTADADAANKSYVDGVAQGLDVKASCVAATTANITIATALNNGDTLDSVALSTGDRVLVKDQTTASQNGIYIVGASPARADDLAAGVDAAGMFTFVEAGSTNGDKGFVCTSNKGSAVVGSNNLAFSQFSSSGDITAGAGLEKNGNILSVDLQANGGLGIANAELFVNLGSSGISGTLAVSDGGTGATSASAARTALGLAIGSDIQAYSAKLLELATMAQTTANKLADLTNTEVAILDGATVSTDELNILDGVTATSTELNYVDGVTSAIQTQLDAKQALDAELTELATMGSTTASALADLTQAEVQILDGATVSTDELNILDGVTATASELNILDGVTATASELNILDGVTASSAEINKLDGLTASTGELNTLNGCLASTTELNILDGATVTTSELNILDGVTATSTELNLLDGVTATTTEINYIDGVTSAIQTQLDAKQGLDAQLTDIAGLAVTNGGFIVGDGSNFVLESGSTARSSLGLGSMATQANNNVNIDGGTIDGITLDGGSYS